MRGYEIHIGSTNGPATARPLLDLATHMDGAISEDGRVMGCYLHGLFDSDPFRRDFLARVRGRDVEGVSYEASVESALDALADHVTAHLDLDRILDRAVTGPASRGEPPRALRAAGRRS